VIKKISILGSTGSIGTQTLDVIREFPQLLKIVGLSAGSNVALLTKQIKEFHPSSASINNKSNAALIKNRCKKLNVHFGDNGNNSIAELADADCVVIATPGLAGINPTLTAIKHKKTIALATKEVLVSAGEIVMTEALKNNVNLLPIDSEHSAIFQCIEGKSLEEIKSIYITCSGGPFRGYKAKQLKKVTIKQALNHPSWKMGKKITVDSATLMNKGFEVIEASWLFNIPLSKIKVIVHPQSIIHSAVEFVDGTIIAQLGPSDMRLPIQHALLYPEKRKTNHFKRFNFIDYPSLTFEEPDLKTFPCLKLAYKSAAQGGTAPAVLTAANDIAVEAFLEEKINFYQIPGILKKVLAMHKNKLHPPLKEILAADEWAREITKQQVTKLPNIRD
jgi:1-deoxy-D-xylulose-5-phosphate reductoisomerase